MVNLKTGVSRKQSTLKFPKNKHFLPPDTHTCVSGGKKCLFFGNFGVLCFLETPVLRFALLPYYRRSYDSHATQLMENKEATITGVNTITRIIQGREQTIKKYLKACQNHRENVEQIIFETHELTEKETIDDTR